jgi:hypothetical protein
MSIKIVITYVGDLVTAHIDGATYKEVGKASSEAIGKLIEAHPTMFDVDIRYNSILCPKKQE